MERSVGKPLSRAAVYLASERQGSEHNPPYLVCFAPVRSAGSSGFWDGMLHTISGNVGSPDDDGSLFWCFEADDLTAMRSDWAIVAGDLWGAVINYDRDLRNAGSNKATRQSSIATVR
jgi:hypothetical protein